MVWHGMTRHGHVAVIHVGVVLAMPSVRVESAWVDVVVIGIGLDLLGLCVR